MRGIEMTKCQFFLSRQPNDMIRRRKVSLFLMFTLAFLTIVLLLDGFEVIDMCDFLQVDLDKSEILVTYWVEGHDQCLEV